MDKLILQRTNADCVVASVAMFTGATYEEVVAAAKGFYPPWRGPEEAVSMSIMWAVCEALRRPVVTSRYFLKDREALITVRSPTSESLYHMIYWDGREVIDPLGPFSGVDENYILTKSIEFTHAVVDLAPLVLERFTFEQAQDFTNREHMAGEQHV